MNSLMLARRTVTVPSRIPSACQLRPYAAKASVNTAIARGLRKSKGVGFRNTSSDHPNVPRPHPQKYGQARGVPPHNSQRQNNDERATYGELREREKGDRFPDQAWRAQGEKAQAQAQAQVRTGTRSYDGNTAAFSRTGTRFGRSSGESKSRERRGRFEDEGSGASISTIFDQGSDRKSSKKAEGPDRPERARFGNRGDPGKLAYTGDRNADRPARPSKFRTQSGSRPSDRSPQLKFPQRPEGSIPKPSYPSLSFRRKAGDTQYGNNSSSATTSSKSRSISEREASHHKLASDRKSFKDSESNPSRSFREKASSESPLPQFEGRSVGPGSRSDKQERSGKPFERGSNLGAKRPYDQRHGDSAVSQPRIMHIADHKIPLSVPYTTPASEFLYGTSVVEAALMSRRIPKRKLYKLYIYTGENREDANRDSRIQRLARKNGVDVVRVGNEWVRLMDKMSAGRPHNGYILEASPLPRLPVTHLGEFKPASEEQQEGFEVTIDYQSREEAAVNGTENFIRVAKSTFGRKPFVLLLDSIVDPGNLGGIIRTASFLGVSAIAISTRNSASFTPVVLKASAGASENVTLFSVNKPSGFVVDSKAAGWKVFAAVAPSKRDDPHMPKSISTDSLDDPLSESPCILMLGGEGEGLRWNLRSKADVDLYIPGCDQSYTVDSLNVSVATGILCNSFLRKKIGNPAEEVADGEAESRHTTPALSASGDLF
ncbi:hypothetical protein LZ554_007319 [Drepanopeziza brunnea f. sp. 'monogermtubi']|nr:hypothetical protein LZ554_007319 [Drepanopeziza brunnea f. sp. 'monogermtubi']